MGKRDKLFFLIWFLLTSVVPLNAEESSSDGYLKYVSEIVDSFTEEMEKEHGLICIGSGGRMPTDVEEIDVIFIAYRKATVDEARKMEVCGIQKLLAKINSHQKIKPYLRTYPFNSDRVGVSISFRTEKDERPRDGSVAYVSLAKNKIFYDIAEMRKEKRSPFFDVRDPKNMIELSPEREEVIERLVLLHEEPYADAVKLVTKLAN